MITNATLSNVTPAPTSSPKGKMTYGAGTTLDLRVTLVNLNRGQAVAVDTRVSNADGVLYVLMSEVPAGVSFDPQGRVTIAQDEQPAIVYQLTKVTTDVKAGGLSHFECFVKRVSP